MEEGLPQAYARHQEMHERLVQGLESIGLTLPVDPRFRLPMLNAVTVPDGVDEAAVRRALLDTYNIEIGAGLGPLAGKIWRIGLMGYTAQKENVDQVVSALKNILKH